MSEGRNHQETPRTHIIHGLSVTVVAALIALLYPFPAPAWGGWSPLVWNWAHAPLFALVSWPLVLYFRLSRRSWRTSFILLGVTLFASTTLVEVLQLFTGRSADWRDVVTGILGGACGGTLAAVYVCHRDTKRLKWGPLCVALTLGLLSSLPLLNRGWAEHKYHKSFPTLESFTPASHRDFWLIELDGKPMPLPEFSDGLELAIPSRGRLAVHYDSQDQDWRAATALAFDYGLTGEGGNPTPLGVRIDGVGHLRARIRLGCDLKPGSHTAILPLPQGNEDQYILGEVRKLVIFTQDAGAPSSLSLRNLRLVLK